MQVALSVPPPAATAARGSPDTPGDLLPQLQAAMSAHKASESAPVAGADVSQPPQTNARSLLARLMPGKPRGPPDPVAGRATSSTDAPQPAATARTAGGRHSVDSSFCDATTSRSHQSPRPPPGPPLVPASGPPALQQQAAAQQAAQTPDLLGPLLAAGRAGEGAAAGGVLQSAPAGLRVPSPQKARSNAQASNDSPSSGSPLQAPPVPQPLPSGHRPDQLGAGVAAQQRDAVREAVASVLQDDDVVDALARALQQRGFVFNVPDSG